MGRAKVSGEANGRGFVMDHVHRQWTKWEEGAKSACCTYVEDDGEIWVAVYGSEYRFGFFSLLSEVQFASFDAAESFVDWYLGQQEMGVSAG